MELTDSRRLTGPGPLLDGPGAVIEVRVEDGAAAPFAAAWEAHARRVLEAVGWGSERTRVARYPGGLSLAMTAPLDALYAATEANEWAFAAAAAQLRGEPVPSLDEGAARLREEIAREANPRLAVLADAARERGVAFLADDEAVTVGMGAGAATWPPDALPAPDAVEWACVHDVPVALVTGTNGKTTSVRLLAAIAAAAGIPAGYATTDEVVVGGETVERGDFAGPMGARRVLRDPRVRAAVLETARGGMMRRGLVVGRARAALVTNVAADHLGEFGVHDLEALAAVKLAVAAVVEPGGQVVLNAEDTVLAEAAAGRVSAPVTWFASSPEHPPLPAHLAARGRACFVENGRFVLARGSERIPLLRVDEAPVTMGGAAAHNVRNALGALGVAWAMGWPTAAMAQGLRAFGADGRRNEGRAEVLEVGGARVVVDFAHNPHAMEALAGLARALPASRRLVLLGQAGDRDDDAVRELVRAAVALGPDHVVVKEMKGLLRGRAEGEIPALIRDELRACGVPDGAVEDAPSELEGVRRALAWARPGDLLVLPVHKQRSAVMALLSRLAASGWKAGEPLPDAGEG